MFSKDSVDFDTRVLLNTLHKHKGELENQLLDMGYDYGVVGIVTKKAQPGKQAETVDINPRAMELARDNAEKNNIEVNVCVSDVYEQVSRNTFTDIITDPLIRTGKNVIYNILKKAWDHLAGQGILWVVIRKQQGACSAVMEIREVSGNCDIIHKERGYFIPKARRALTI